MKVIQEEGQWRNSKNSRMAKTNPSAITYPVMDTEEHTITGKYNDPVGR